MSYASDGEKLVFALLAECVANGQDEVIFVVDEPEAHLNPQLACKVWDLLEQKLPHCQFIYATHCPSFAMRQSVGALFILGDESKLSRLADFSDLAPSQAEQFLGALPLVVYWKRAIGVEGDDLSFDSRFYPLILQRDDIAVVPLGSKNEVRGETSRLALWKKLAPTASILGLVDRDNGKFGGGTDTLMVLSYNEAESYLCHPEVVAATVVALFGGDHMKARGRAIDVIVDEAKKMRVALVNQIASNALEVTYSLAVSVGAARRFPSETALAESLKQKANEMKNSANELLADSNIERAIKAGKEAVNNAIVEQNIEALLSMLPGKQLLRSILASIGLRGVDEYLNVIDKHIIPQKLPVLMSLRDEILRRLEQ